MCPQNPLDTMPGIDYLQTRHGVWLYLLCHNLHLNSKSASCFHQQLHWASLSEAVAAWAAFRGWGEKGIWLFWPLAIFNMLWQHSSTQTQQPGGRFFYEWTVIWAQAKQRRHQLKGRCSKLSAGSHSVLFPVAVTCPACLTYLHVVYGKERLECLKLRRDSYAQESLLHTIPKSALPLPTVLPGWWLLHRAQKLISLLAPTWS